jgi:hypothetical protein
MSANRTLNDTFHSWPRAVGCLLQPQFQRQRHALVERHFGARAEQHPLLAGGIAIHGELEKVRALIEITLPLIESVCSIVFFTVGLPSTTELPSTLCHSLVKTNHRLVTPSRLRDVRSCFRMKEQAYSGSVEASKRSIASATEAWVAGEVLGDRAQYRAAVDRWIAISAVVKLSEDDLHWLHPEARGRERSHPAPPNCRRSHDVAPFVDCRRSMVVPSRMRVEQVAGRRCEAGACRDQARHTSVVESMRRQQNALRGVAEEPLGGGGAGRDSVGEAAPCAV